MGELFVAQSHILSLDVDPSSPLMNGQLLRSERIEVQICFPQHSTRVAHWGRI